MKKWMKSIIVGMTSFMLGTTILESTTVVNAVESPVLEQNQLKSYSMNYQQAYKILLDYGYTDFELKGTPKSVLVQCANEVLQRSWVSVVTKYITRFLEKHLGRKLSRQIARHCGSFLNFARRVVSFGEIGTEYTKHKVYDFCRRHGFSKKVSTFIANICSYAVEIIGA